MWQQFLETGINPWKSRQMLTHMRKKFRRQSGSTEATTTEEGRSGGVVESVECPACGATMTTWFTNAINQAYGTIDWKCPNGHVVATYPDGTYYSDWGY